MLACFDPTVEPLEDYIGPDVLPCVDRVGDGRALTLLGHSRQRIPGNWKLMQENIKDPYHPGLLHTWFVTFGLWRADNKSELKMDRHHRHAAMISTRGQSGKADQLFRNDGDKGFVDVAPEGSEMQFTLVGQPRAQLPDHALAALTGPSEG